MTETKADDLRELDRRMAVALGWTSAILTRAFYEGVEQWTRPDGTKTTNLPAYSSDWNPIMNDVWPVLAERGLCLMFIGALHDIVLSREQPEDRLSSLKADALVWAHATTTDCVRAALAVLEKDADDR